MEKILWLVLGGITFLAALRAERSAGALHIARVAPGALYIGAGAVVNATYLATGTDYSGVTIDLILVIVAVAQPHWAARLTSN